MTLAGTVYQRADALTDDGLDGVDVVVTDDAGQVQRLHSNGAGNFYTRRALRFPVTVELVGSTGDSVKMKHDVGLGECSSCHDLPPGDGALGRVYFAP